MGLVETGTTQNLDAGAAEHDARDRAGEGGAGRGHAADRAAVERIIQVVRAAPELESMAIVLLSETIKMRGWPLADDIANRVRTAWPSATQAENGTASTSSGEPTDHAQREHPALAIAEENRGYAAAALGGLLGAAARAEGAVRFGADQAEISSTMEEVLWFADQARTALDARTAALLEAEGSAAPAMPADSAASEHAPEPQAADEQTAPAAEGGLFNIVRDTIAAADRAGSQASRAAGHQVMAEAYEQHRLNAVAALETGIAHAQLALAAVKWEPANVAVLAQYVGQANRCLGLAGNAIEARLQLAEIKGRVMAARGETVAPAA